MNTLQSQDAATPPLPDSTRLIHLTQGKSAIVDAADFEWLNQWKWCASCPHGHWYATRGIYRRNGSNITIHMHRLILGVTNPKTHVDHRDGDGLNNTRQNIRACTSSGNQQNRGPSKHNTSGYKGVDWSYRCGGKWQAKIGYNGKRYFLGYFSDIEDAARAYDEAALKHHGEFAHLNFPKISLDTKSSI